jgi:hypothetical protein
LSETSGQHMTYKKIFDILKNQAGDGHYWFK